MLNTSQHGGWRSLCQRRGKYEFVDPSIIVEDPDEEGFVSMAVTESAVPPSTSLNPPDLYLPESLFRWTGWSLCVPRPVKRLNFENKSEEFKRQAETEFQLITSFSIYLPGSLPRLRFGHPYRMRARAVDLAGNGLSLDEANKNIEIATEKILYLRYEPISAPAIVLLKSIESSPGESPETLVIRSGDIVPTENSERHIAPPLGAPSLCETHGKFDDPITGLKKMLLRQLLQRKVHF